MIQIADTAPDIEVAPAEYRRLLGYPRDHAMEGRALELSEWARDWYTRNGRPWIYAREAESLAVAGDAVRIEGVSFTSPRLAGTLSRAGAHGAILVAAGAGAEAEEYAQRLWIEEKPDEYFFLEVFGSAVVEHLTMQAGARLCGTAEANGIAVLPHYSPGYPEWDIAQQPRLLELLRPFLPRRLDVLESGMLTPKKSLLAVFGLTRHTDQLRRLTDLAPCQTCSLAGCQYRRVPYRTNLKALRRWAAERVSFEARKDGGLDALFRYDGTTCANTGRPLTFYYGVSLGPSEAGHPIQEQWCGPAPGDAGHTFMCGYVSDRGALMAAIASEKPLLGRPLEEALAWQRPFSPAGCYCEPASRQHKWGLALETIHYALAGREEKTA